MKQHTTFARSALAVLCALTVLTGFAGSAHAGGEEASSAANQRWSVHSECTDGQGSVWVIVYGPNGYQNSSVSNFSCSGDWTATVNLRAASSDPKQSRDGGLSAAEALAEVVEGRSVSGAERFMMFVDCADGAHTATIYFHHVAISTSDVDCHGMDFSWGVNF